MFVSWPFHVMFLRIKVHHHFNLPIAFENNIAIQDVDFVLWVYHKFWTDYFILTRTHCILPRLMLFLWPMCIKQLFGGGEGDIRFWYYIVPHPIIIYLSIWYARILATLYLFLFIYWHPISIPKYDLTIFIVQNVIILLNVHPTIIAQA